MAEPGPSSPCLNICSLDELGVCRGCFRTITEIASWTRMGPDEQWTAMKRAEQRRQAIQQQRSK